MSEALKNKYKELSEAGFDPKRLVVVNYSGQEQVIGNLEETERPIYGSDNLSGVSLKLRNPKRFVRLQSMTAQGFSVNFIVGDLDFMDEGTCWVRGTLAYRLTDISSDQGQIDFIEVILDFVKRKKAFEAAANSRIHLPETPFLDPRRR